MAASGEGRLEGGGTEQKEKKGHMDMDNNEVIAGWRGI